MNILPYYTDTVGLIIASSLQIDSWIKVYRTEKENFNILRWKSESNQRSIGIFVNFAFYS